MQPTTSCPTSIRPQAGAVAERLSSFVDLDVLSARAAAEVHRLLSDHLICVTWVAGDSAGAKNSALPWLVVGAARGHRDADITGLRIPPGTGVGGLVAARCQLVSVSDYAREGANRDFLDLMVGREGIRGAAGVPLWSDGRVCGVLFAGRRHGGELAGRALDLLVEISKHLGEMIGRARKVEHRLTLARTEERQRVVTELHDDVTQLLFAVGASARRARQVLDGTSPRADQELERVESLSSAAATAVRRTLRSAAPVPPDEDLPLLLRSTVDKCMERFGTPAELVVLDAVPAQPPAVCSALAAVAREALANVAKHAPGASAVVTLTCDERDVTLAVQDDGPGLAPGFELKPVAFDDADDHFGLPSLAYRVSLLGGELSVRNNDDGVTLRVSLPRVDGR